AIASLTRMTETENVETKLNFSQDELILCFHGPLLYEAKILKAENWGPDDSESGETGPHYFVHYKGWKKTWDEWVPEERVVKYNDANLARQRQLKDTYTNKKKKSANKERQNTPQEPLRLMQARTNNFEQNRQKIVNRGQQKSSSPEQIESPNSDESSIKQEDEEMLDIKDEHLEPDNDVQENQSQQRTKKRKSIDEDEDDEEEFMNRLEIKISLPESLKCRLIDDWENITRNHALLKLPRSPTVSEILKQYLEYKRSSSIKSEKSDIYTEVAHGIQVYFEKTLGNILLYGYERQQYVDVRKQFLEKENAEIYGAEHLLRLFVELPRLLVHTHMDQTTTETLEEHLADFLKFLQKNEDQYFVTEYERHGDFIQFNGKQTDGRLKTNEILLLHFQTLSNLILIVIHLHFIQGGSAVIAKHQTPQDGGQERLRIKNFVM
ncbi:39158_t:CDS:10, partial [Gigaspora margarita]